MGSDCKLGMYKHVIRPNLEYCAQTLSYSQPSELEALTGYAKELKHLPTQILRMLINRPKSSSSAICPYFMRSIQSPQKTLPQARP